MLTFIENYSGLYLPLAMLAFVLAVFFAIVPHEFAHAFCATKNGDNTARLAGRLTLNPFKHIDPLGLICLILLGFGWAKPVPININNFKDRKKGLFLVSMAGIITNFFLSFFFYALYVLVLRLTVANLEASATVQYLLFFTSRFVYFAATINLCLAIFNIFPIPPLDGYNVVVSLSSYENAYTAHMRRFGSIYMLFLIIFAEFFIGYAVSFLADSFVYFWALCL